MSDLRRLSALSIQQFLNDEGPLHRFFVQVYARPEEQPQSLASTALTGRKSASRATEGFDAQWDAGRHEDIRQGHPTSANPCAVDLVNSLELQLSEYKLVHQVQHDVSRWVAARLVEPLGFWVDEPVERAEALTVQSDISKDSAADDYIYPDALFQQSRQLEDQEEQYVQPAFSKCLSFASGSPDSHQEVPSICTKERAPQLHSSEYVDARSVRCQLVLLEETRSILDDPSEYVNARSVRCQSILLEETRSILDDPGQVEARPLQRLNSQGGSNFGMHQEGPLAGCETALAVSFRIYRHTYLLGLTKGADFPQYPAAEPSVHGSDSEYQDSFSRSSSCRYVSSQALLLNASC